jgi:hypothetical protein
MAEMSTSGSNDLDTRPEHTPGPWEQHGDIIVRLGEGGRNICAICGHKPEDDSIRYIDAGYRWDAQMRANADLIAAAPEMLAALKAAQEELRLLRMKDAATVYNPGLNAQISIAIAKAERGQ